MKKKKSYKKPKFVLNKISMYPAKKPIFKDEIGFKPFMKLRFPKQFKFNLDSDRDGVPDWKDCKPFDRRRQHFKSTTNSIKVSIIVPATVNVDEKISDAEHDRRTAEVEQLLSGIFGGSTTYTKGKGSWIHNKTTEPIREEVAVVTSYTDPKTFKKYENYLQQSIKERQMWWGQEAVSITIEDVQRPTNPKSGMHFISIPKKQQESWLLSQQ